MNGVRADADTLGQKLKLQESTLHKGSAWDQPLFATWIALVQDRNLGYIALPSLEPRWVVPDRSSDSAPRVTDKTDLALAFQTDCLAS